MSIYDFMWAKRTMILCNVRTEFQLDLIIFFVKYEFGTNFK